AMYAGLSVLSTVLLMLCFRFVFFFFSSRRRHTRSTRDWSSDVCSSDLGSAIVTGAGGGGQGRAVALRLAREGAAVVISDVDESRSEERRVGKEGRSRWGRGP